MKKIRYLVFGLVFACLGLTSFSSAENYACYDQFTISEDSYFIIDSVYGSNNGWFNVVKGGSNEQYCYSINDGITFNNSCSSIDSYPLILSPGEWAISCMGSLDGVFSVVPVSSNSDCPSVPSGGSCSNTGTVSDLTNRVLLYTGSVSLNNSSYTNIFNYGNNGAGTYCVKLSSSSPQTLTFGFANGGTTTPTNLYQLYNDQYGQVVCLYGNKPYFNAKLNSSSNTVSYEVYKLSDLYSSNVCLENECETCQECEDCSSCESSLGACLEDNLSLENMNDSLSSQLESCLLNGGNGCDPEVDTGCITGAFQVPLLSWSVGLDSFTTPIINNLTLPTNYKGKIVDGVLTISSVNNNLSISDSDMEEIKDSIVEVSQYIFRLALILMIIYYIKFYIFNSKK